MACRKYSYPARLKVNSTSTQLYGLRTAERPRCFSDMPSGLLGRAIQHHRNVCTSPASIIYCDVTSVRQTFFFFFSYIYYRQIKKKHSQSMRRQEIRTNANKKSATRRGLANKSLLRKYCVQIKGCMADNRGVCVRSRCCYILFQKTITCLRIRRGVSHKCVWIFYGRKTFITF